MEGVDESLAIIRLIADDCWTVAGHCAASDEAAEALSRLMSAMRTLLEMDDAADKELIELGYREFLQEVAVVESSGNSRSIPG